LTVAVTATAVVIVAIAAFFSRDSLVEQYYLWRLESSNEDTRRAAVEQLAEVRSRRATPTIVELFRLWLRNSNESSTVSGRGFFFLEPGEREPHYTERAIVKLGAHAVPPLLHKYVASTATKDRRALDEAAVFSMWLEHLFEEMGPEAVRGLAGMVSDPDLRTKKRALRSILALLEPPRPTVRTFTEARAFRPLAAREARGAAVAANVPHLTRALDDPDAVIRSHAALALEAAGPAAAPATSRLLELLQDEQAVQGAIQALAGIGVRVVPAVLALGGRTTDSTLRADCARILGGVGTEAMPLLLQGLRTGTLETQLCAAQAFAAMKQIPDAAMRPVAELFPLLPESTVWSLAALYTGLGESAGTAVPVLVRVLDDPRCSAETRHSVSFILGNLGRAAHDAIPALRRLQASDDPDDRFWAEMALEDIPVENKDGPHPPHRAAK